MPSPPRTTNARVPRADSTPATTGSIRASATPTTCPAGRAGFVRGPRKLNTVGMPISLRGTAAWAIAGWKTGANMNAMPHSRRHRATPSGGSATLTPSASSRSADPHREDAARLPCFATTAPAPEATTAAIVETLIVPARSPPVPQVSTTGPGASTCGASASIVRARPETSSGVSPFARNATTKAVTCTGVASPDMIRPIAPAASSTDRSSPARRRESTGGQKSLTERSVEDPDEDDGDHRQAEDEHRDVASLDLAGLHRVEPHRVAPVL